MRSIVVVLSGLVLFLLAGGPLVGASDTLPVLHRVRAASAMAQSVLDDARERSATVRALMDDLSVLDVFVYVELQFDPPVSHGTTRLVAATDTARYVRVALDIMLPPPERLSVLAHELQHALEVAREPGVRDETALRNLFERIGWSVGASAFETQAAIDTERQARLDLYRKVRPDHL